jgi:hypothetical protein
MEITTVGIDLAKNVFQVFRCMGLMNGVRRCFASSCGVRKWPYCFQTCRRVLSERWMIYGGRNKECANGLVSGLL